MEEARGCEHGLIGSDHEEARGCEHGLIGSDHEEVQGSWIEEKAWIHWIEKREDG